MEDFFSNGLAAQMAHFPAEIGIFIVYLRLLFLILLDCRAKEDKWAICRRCLETDKKCFQDPDGCHCENVQVADPTQNDKLIGGSDCKDGFCYISKYIYA